VADIRYFQRIYLYTIVSSASGNKCDALYAPHPPLSLYIAGGLIESTLTKSRQLNALPQLKLKVVATSILGFVCVLLRAALSFWPSLTDQ